MPPRILDSLELAECMFTYVRVCLRRDREMFTRCLCVGCRAPASWVAVAGIVRSLFKGRRLLCSTE